MQKNLAQRFGENGGKVKSIFERGGRFEESNIFDRSVKILFFGKFEHLDSNMGWALRKLQTQEDVLKPENQNVVELLIEVAKKYNLNKIYAPVANPHNGEIMKEGDVFKEEIILNKHEVGNGIKPIYLYRGANYEGLKIKEKGEAFYLPSADCLTVIVQDEFDNIVSFHAGRESLHNINNPFKENPFLQAKRLLKGDVGKMRVWMGYGIAAESFIHELEGESSHVKNNVDRFAQVRYLYNDYGDYPERQIMSVNGAINLFNLATEQAVEAGINRENVEVDERDTFIDEEVYSNRRGGYAKMGRNGVFVFLN